MAITKDIYAKPYIFKSGVTLKNRIVMAPMTVKLSFFNGDVTKDELEYYRLRSGEVGAIITAAANVSPLGKGWEGELSIESDEHINSLSKLSNAIQINDSKAIIQLFHAGRMTNSKILRSNQPVSASAIAAERENAEVPRAMSEEEILQVIEDFKKATVRAYEAGFDGIELHGANTYLIQQFFSPHSNRRNDKWGGSLENRFRFVEKLVDEVLKVRKDFIKPFVIGYRFSPEEFETPGIRLEDTMYLVDKLADKDLDYLHISLNDYKRVSKSDDFKETSILEYVHKKINNRLPLIGVGGILSKKDLEATLENAELAALGRGLLLDPNWTSKIINNRGDFITTSIVKEDFIKLKIPRALQPSLMRMMKDNIK